MSGSRPQASGFGRQGKEVISLLSYFEEDDEIHETHPLLLPRGPRKAGGTAGGRSSRPRRPPRQHINVTPTGPVGRAERIGAEAGKVMRKASVFGAQTIRLVANVWSGVRMAGQGGYFVIELLSYFEEDV